MKRTLMIIACVLASIAMSAQSESNDYIPFIEQGKCWHVVGSVASPESNYRMGEYRVNGSEERDSKTYFHIWKSTDAQADKSDIGLFREEGRRVYKYDEAEHREVMLYDFSQPACLWKGVLQLWAKPLCLFH